MSEDGKSDDGNDNLSDVDVAGAVLRPVVWRSGNNVSVCRTDGDVGTESQTVEAKSPEDVGKEKQTEHLLEICVSM